MVAIIPVSMVLTDLHVVGFFEPQRTQRYTEKTCLLSSRMNVRDLPGLGQFSLPLVEMTKILTNYNSKNLCVPLCPLWFKLLS